VLGSQAGPRLYVSSAKISTSSTPVAAISKVTGFFTVAPSLGLTNATLAAGAPPLPALPAIPPEPAVPEIPPAPATPPSPAVPPEPPLSLVVDFSPPQPIASKATKSQRMARAFALHTSHLCSRPPRRNHARRC
jgi:hypothetical protein